MSTELKIKNIAENIKDYSVMVSKTTKTLRESGTIPEIAKAIREVAFAVRETAKEIQKTSKVLKGEGMMDAGNQTSTKE
jgi:methyl-accepting chemotaxis protein